MQPGFHRIYLSKRFAYLFDPRLDTSTLHFYNMVNHAMREYVQHIEELDTDGQVRKVLEPTSGPSTLGSSIQVVVPP